MLPNKVALMVMRYYAEFPHLLREDLLHTQEVVSFTRAIAAGENMSAHEVEMLECAAWLHDIGCPRSKEIHGNSLPVNQQAVGREVTRELLADFSEFSAAEKQWLEDVVGTHHQLSSSKELRFAPLFEADIFANLLSGYHKKEQAESLYKNALVTATSKALFRDVVCPALGITPLPLC
ncbi:MAG: HD domain-containing protein [Rikenellaceae bacterium]